MDDLRVGAVLRALRLRKRWTQQQLADASRVSRAFVSQVEAGRLEHVDQARLRRVGRALGARIEHDIRGPVELDRVLNARHAAMHESMARLLRSIPGWRAVHELSFSIYGERGVIDIVAWHEGRRALLIIELKSSLVDVNDLMATMDRRRRLADRIARERGWDPASVSVWVVLADTPANHRRLAAHATVLRSAFPADGRAMRGWLRAPARPTAALSFLSNVTGGSVKGGSDRRERVRLATSNGDRKP